MSKKIMKREPHPMAGMGNMFQKMMIPQIKQISPNANFVERFIHNRRVNDFVKIAEGELRIIEAQAKTFTAMMTVYDSVATHNDRLNLEYMERQHRRTMMSIEQKERREIVTGIMLDNQMKQRKIEHLGLEIEISKIETEVRINELRQYMMGKK